MTPQQAQLLLQRYLDGECTAEESAKLEAWWSALHDENPWDLPAGQDKMIHDRMLSKIKGELAGELPERRLPWRRYAAIAAAVFVLAAGAWFFMAKRNTGTAGPVAVTEDRFPGGNHAVLTIAGERPILLDSIANGVLALQGKDRILKQNGTLDYTGISSGHGDEEGRLNMLTTPRGGQYQLILPDGTRVWLDAASSITYPTSFGGKTRRVSITGQAYFEVVHNAQRPFEVSVQGQVIRDIGTAFNINAYTDEPVMHITLASGSVAVGEPGHQVILQKSGQQVECDGGKLGTVNQSNLASVLAWKNGLFYFSSTDIGTVMRQVARWYDIDVVYESGVPSGHITGKVPRDMNLSTVLRVLQTSGVHFSVQGKTVHVTP